MQCSGEGSQTRNPSGNNFSASKGFQCAHTRMDWAVFYCTVTETPWQVKDEGWHQPAAVTLHCVCRETPNRTITAVSASHTRKACLSGLRKPSKLNFVPSKNAPVAMKLMELEGIFRQFFWNSNSHSHRSSKLWAEQRQVSTREEKKVGWAVS